MIKSLDKKFSNLQSPKFAQHIDEIYGEMVYHQLRKGRCNDELFTSYKCIINNRKNLNLKYNKEMYSFLLDLYLKKIKKQ